MLQRMYLKICNIRYGEVHLGKEVAVRNTSLQLISGRPEKLHLSRYLSVLINRCP